MAKSYTLIAKTHFSGVGIDINIGDEIKNLTPIQVERYLSDDSASFKTKKELESYLVELEESKKEQSENEAKAKAILEHETIKNDLIAMYENVVKKEAELLGLVYEDEVILSKVEELLLRVETKKDEDLEGK